MKLRRGGIIEPANVFSRRFNGDACGVDSDTLLVDLTLLSGAWGHMRCRMLKHFLRAGAIPTTITANVGYEHGRRLPNTPNKARASSVWSLLLKRSVFR